MSVGLRRADAVDDLEAAVALWREARWDRGFAVQRGDTLEGDRRHFAGAVFQRFQVWFASEGASVVGLIAFDAAKIDQLHVAPAYQGLGIGSLLLAKAREDAGATLELVTHQGNDRARSFYERHGFRAIRFAVSAEPEAACVVRYQWSRDGA